MTAPLSNETDLKRSLQKKVAADNPWDITVEELIWYWRNQFYSPVGQATLNKIERLQELESRHV